MASPSRGPIAAEGGGQQQGNQPEVLAISSQAGRNGCPTPQRRGAKGPLVTLALTHGEVCIQGIGEVGAGKAGSPGPHRQGATYGQQAKLP